MSCRWLFAHVTFSVQQSQRSVELLLNGEVNQRAEMSEGGKLFTDGGGMPLVMGAFGADGTCCISHLHVYPTCSLSRGSAKQVYQAQRSMLGEKVEPEVPLGVPSTITALGPSASLKQRLETICSSDARAGWPASKPGVGVSHDTTWCLAQHQMTLAHHLSESTQCVVELGAWLGKFALTRLMLHILISACGSIRQHHAVHHAARAERCCVCRRPVGQRRAAIGPALRRRGAPASAQGPSPLRFVHCEHLGVAWRHGGG